MHGHVLYLAMQLIVYNVCGAILSFDAVYALVNHHNTVIVLQKKKTRDFNLSGDDGYETRSIYMPASILVVEI